MAQWKLLISQNKIHKGATLSVNISAKSLQDRNFLEFFEEIFDQTKLPRENVILEVTESVMINKTDVATETLLEVRKRG
jgi:EAL domain-containing protein (putative c-di-GMP-specific phosphodiesterase class I)